MIQNSEHQPMRTVGFTFLSIVNAVGLCITVAFWAVIFFRHAIPYPNELVSLPERANAAVTYGFMIGDILYSVPLLCLSWIGLWRMKSWGWLAAQMTNALWVYSMTVILLRDAYTQISPGGLLFVPFALIAIWSIPYLWIHRTKFGIAE